MAYTINDCDLIHIKPFVFEQGKNSYFANLNNTEGNFLLKFFNGDDEEIIEKVKIVNRLKKLNYEGLNAFPIDSVSVCDVEKGLICNYFKDALTFMEKDCLQLPYDLRYKAVNDITKQLFFLHSNGFIANDIRLSNCMISPLNQCGLLIDFEDMIAIDDYKIKSAHYRFYKMNYYIMLPPSTNEDVKKLFICILSILLGYDFETYVIAKDEYSLLKKLFFDKELYDFAKQLFYCNDVLYFDEISSLFKDEDQAITYKREMKL